MFSVQRTALSVAALSSLITASIAVGSDRATPHEVTGLGKPLFEMVGNPINQASGNKYQKELDYQGYGSNALEISRTYNSKANGASGLFGKHWVSYYERRVELVTEPTYSYVRLRRHDGKSRVLDLDSAGLPINPSSRVDQLEKLLDSQGLHSGWKYTDSRDTVELYDTLGRLVSIDAEEGSLKQLTYDTFGHLDTVADESGRILDFDVDANGLVTEVRNPAGDAYQYVYDASANLITVVYPDLASVQYLYNEQQYTQNTQLPHALTGMIDENGTRAAIWKYDTEGRAVSSEHALGADLTTLSYGNDETIVTNALGGMTRYGFGVVEGRYRMQSIKKENCVCGPNETAMNYSSNGDMEGKRDPNYGITSWVRDSAGRVTRRTDANGDLDVTQWHPDFNKPVSVTRSGHKILTGYDPVSGSVVSRTEKVGSKTRVTTYSYNASGKLAIFDGPRTDIADSVSYSYHANLDLHTVTNGEGHVTTLSSYDSNGYPLLISDANGLVTQYAYDARQRVTSINEGGRTTLLTYTATGRVNTITGSNGLVVTYHYDLADRLVGSTNSHGDQLVYTLDAAGNRVQEQVKDAGDSVVFSLTRTFSPHGFMTSETDGEGNTSSYTYDPVGNLVSIEDPAGKVTSYTYDALNRPLRSTNPLNEQSAVVYNTWGDIESVRLPSYDFTNYTVNKFGEVTKRVSPDTGTTRYTYDKAGNMLTVKDARNKKTTYAYDALNRLVSEAYQGGGSSTFAYDQTANGLGRLSVVTDDTGSKTYTYSIHGDVTQRTQVTNGVSLVTNYSYDAAGRLTGVTYPSGAAVTFGYVLDRPSSISLNGTLVVSAIGYDALGRMTSLSYTSGITLERTFDLAGRLSTWGQAGAATSLTYDSRGRITLQDRPSMDTSYSYDDAGQLLSYTEAGETVTYTYGSQGNRNTLTTTSGDDLYYSYGNGNRLNAVRDTNSGASQPISRDNNGNRTAFDGNTYAYDSRNRLESFTKAGVSTDYSINGLGERVAKLDSQGNGKLYSYAAPGALSGEYELQGTPISEFVYVGGRPIGLIRDSAFHAVSTDSLGAPVQVFDSNGASAWELLADPWGAGLPNEDPSGLGIFTLDLRLPGQVFDNESGLHYNYFRDYDPTLGRYIQSDPIGLRGGPNSYAYVGGRPTKFVDPTGEFAALAPLLTPQNVMAAAAGVGALYCLITNCTDGIDPFTQPQLNEESSDEPEQCPAEDDYPANPDDWTPPEGWEETSAGEHTNGRHRQWRDPDGKIRRRWDSGGDPLRQPNMGPHWWDSRTPKKHIPPNR